MTTKRISAEEFDRRFDAGEDIADHLDFENVRTVLPCRVPAEVGEPAVQRLARLRAKTPRSAHLEGLTSEGLKRELEGRD